MPPLVTNPWCSALLASLEIGCVSACRALTGLPRKRRAPDLYAWFGATQCETVETADHLAKIVEVEMATLGGDE
jgi:hypothetical protein